ncbi:Nuclear envelope morphology protein 1 [Myotisia sp. PD_48]|nr:Nuclear envelope morphology protein 1 [Myotisia sp. PD_48]
MNSLNILSSRVIGQASNSAARRPRSSSRGNTLSGSRHPRSELANSRSYSEGDLSRSKSLEDDVGSEDELAGLRSEQLDYEKSPKLLVQELHEIQEIQGHDTRKAPSATREFLSALTEALKAIISVFASPVLYLGSRLIRGGGQLYFIGSLRSQQRPDPSSDEEPQPLLLRGNKSGSTPETKISTSRHKVRASTSNESLYSNTSESETDRHQLGGPGSSTHRRQHSRKQSNTSVPDNEEGTPRRSIRIKIQNESKRKHRDRASSTTQHNNDTKSISIADKLKSPISPSVHTLTKYPHAPAPPRPLIPQRQPSYLFGSTPSHMPQKTLVLDLDETLIHSLSKGGRMSSGHMVEVKLASTMIATSPGSPPTALGPQHPILYYVHKRPHCDTFLRKVCQWYKLVIFTASVQEYADPVIDWLEQERKYFHGRYYRQHCTIRNGAYIKDLSSVEPDLSKVMILDNSPMSYIFHEDNAIPIEGWINDPTDNDLLHLIPILEALQYVTDVRALLALRRGEATV